MTTSNAASAPSTKPAREQSPDIALFHCAFCGRDNRSVGKMIAGPGVAICGACVGRCSEIVARGGQADNDATPPFGAWERLDDATLLAAMRSTEGTLSAIRSIQRDQVNVLRIRGTSWAVIGDALGISRQSAWERFGGGKNS